MQGVGLFFLITVIVILAVVMTVFSYRARKKRREALKMLADQLGWSFDPSSDRHLDREFRQFKIFQQGHSRSAYNTLRGLMEIKGLTCRCKAGDYLYKVTSSNGKSQQTTTYTFSYLIVDHPFHNLPHLVIRPEHMFDKLASAFGFDDIDFESAEFSKRFFIKCKDKQFAYNVIDQRMMDFLLADTPGMFDLESEDCCLSDGKSTWTPEQFRLKINWMIQFFDHWPDFVVEELLSQ